MIATIELDKIELWAYHGCYEQEQVVGNRYEIDIKLMVDIDKAVETDNVQDALNYVEVYEIVKEEMAKTQHLVESVATNIGKSIRNRFSEELLKGINIRVAKMAPPVGGKMRDVAINLTF
ncbi:MAG: dihydroneopterin aldolase [Bacteroidia bacterium]|nr:dihydroneopterin aldolase [Bacteroidia bacterium]